VRLEGLGILKNPPHPGLEPVTFQLLAYCLNQLRYRVLNAKNTGHLFSSSIQFEKPLKLVVKT
jgi:hypothetical protein